VISLFLNIFSELFLFFLVFVFFTGVVKDFLGSGVGHEIYMASSLPRARACAFGGGETREKGIFVAFPLACDDATLSFGSTFRSEAIFYSFL